MTVTEDFGLQVMLDGLHANAVVIDSRGIIRAANQGWLAFAQSAGVISTVGTNFLEACEGLPGERASGMMSDVPELSQASEPSGTSAAPDGSAPADVSRPSLPGIAVADGLRDILGGRGEGLWQEYHYTTLEGEHWYLVTARPMRTPWGPGAMVCHADVTRLHRTSLETDYYRHHEPVTGAPNRLAFERELNTALQRSRRVGRRVGVLELDINGFGAINNAFGYQTGDQVLGRVVRRLEQVVRPGDAVASLGGDNFLVLLTDLHSFSGLDKPLARIREAVARPFRLGGNMVRLTCSIGVSLSPEGMGKCALLEEANEALSRALAAGSDTVSFYDDSLSRASVERLRTLSELREALDSNQFELYFQPQMAMDGKTLVGAEALVRWRHPTRGLVPPGAFLPLIDTAGLSARLGEHVLAEAVERLAQLGPAAVPVAINLAAAELEDPTYAERAAATLAAHGVMPGMLAFEVTEQSLISNVDAARATIKALNAMGSKVAIDDFGTGYSSLSYLSTLPVAVLKIDKSFVHALGEHDSGDTIVRAIIKLAHALGMEVLAEGVETDEQRCWLVERECDHIQGYWIAPPLPFTDFRDRFVEGAKVPL